MRALKEGMGYPYCVLFPRARDAILAYSRVNDCVLRLPENICPELVDHLGSRACLMPVDNTRGHAFSSQVSMYGYRWPMAEKLEVDPHMAGWRDPRCVSTIVSFGRKKFISLGWGGAFLTEDKTLAREMQAKQWPNLELEYPEWAKELEFEVCDFDLNRKEGFDKIAKWDDALGDLLTRIPLEQKTPWRVMRRAPHLRGGIVRVLRAAGLYASTNYPPIKGSNIWGDTVISFMPDHDPGPTVEIIKRVLND